MDYKKNWQVELVSSDRLESMCNFHNDDDNSNSDVAVITVFTWVLEAFDPKAQDIWKNKL